MNLFDRILYQKDKGNSSNYNLVFSDLRSLIHSEPEKFNFDNYEITWTYFRPVDFYNDIILDNDETVFFYLRNENLTFEALFCGHSSDYNKPLVDKEVSINSIYVFGLLFPGLDSYEKRPIRISSNNRLPNCPLKKMNYHFRTTLEKYNQKTKPIFELTDYYKDNKGWSKIVDKERRE